MQGAFKMYQILLLPKYVKLILGFFVCFHTGFLNCKDIEKIRQFIFVIITFFVHSSTNVTILCEQKWNTCFDLNPTTVGGNFDAGGMKFLFPKTPLRYTYCTKIRFLVKVKFQLFPLIYFCVVLFKTLPSTHSYITLLAVHWDAFLCSFPHSGGCFFLYTCNMTNKTFCLVQYVLLEFCTKKNLSQQTCQLNHAEFVLEFLYHYQQAVLLQFLQRKF